MRKKVAVAWNVVMGAVALGVAAVAANAQPMFQTKTVEIAKRPTQPATRAGDLMTASVVTLHFRDATLREGEVDVASNSPRRVRAMHGHPASVFLGFALVS